MTKISESSSDSSKYTDLCRGGSDTHDHIITFIDWLLLAFYLTIEVSWGVHIGEDSNV